MTDEEIKSILYGTDNRAGLVAILLHCVLQSNADCLTIPRHLFEEAITNGKTSFQWRLNEDRNIEVLNSLPKH